MLAYFLDHLLSKMRFSRSWTCFLVEKACHWQPFYFHKLHCAAGLDTVGLSNCFQQFSTTIQVQNYHQQKNSQWLFFCWWGQLDLNQRPIGYEPTALTTELCPLV
jgi:hypothetical protein